MAEINLKLSLHFTHREENGSHTEFGWKPAWETTYSRSLLANHDRCGANHTRAPMA